MKLAEALNEIKYVVTSSGGSIGASNDKKPSDSMIFTDKEEAKAKAKRMNKSLSPGEKKYYKIKYSVKELK